MMETLGHFAAGMLQLFLPAAATVALVGGPCAYALRRLTALTFREGGILMLGLSFCGYVVGVIGGNSASPIAQTLVTGLIGLLGGLVAYLHTRESTRTTGVRTLASLGLVGLLAAVLIGLLVGGANKRRFTQHEALMARYGVYFKDFAVPLCLEEKKRALDGKAFTPSQACATLEAGIR